MKISLLPMEHLSDLNCFDMRYIDKVIQGESNFKAFIKKIRPTYTIEMCENTGHVGDIHFERFYEKRPQDEYYKEFYWLTMASNSDKGFTDGQYSDRRRQIYEGIRTGAISGEI